MPRSYPAGSRGIARDMEQGHARSQMARQTPTETNVVFTRFAGAVANEDALESWFAGRRHDDGGDIRQAKQLNDVLVQMLFAFAQMRGHDQHLKQGSRGLNGNLLHEVARGSVNFRLVQASLTAPISDDLSELRG